MTPSLVKSAIHAHKHKEREREIVVGLRGGNRVGMFLLFLFLSLILSYI